MMKMFVIIVMCGMAFCNVAYSQSQSKMNQSAGDTLAASEAKMQTVLKKIEILYKDKKEFLNKLRISQECWLKFREAQLDALYPAKDKQSAYGSSFPMAYALYKKDLNNQRIAQLMPWVNGIEEGNCGSGSVKFKSQLQE